MERDYETIIVGAGPAGLQMGYFMERAGRSYLIVEARATAGSLFLRYPRHRTLISLNKRFNFYPEPTFNLRHDWNSLLSDDPSLLFTRYSDELYPAADDYVRYLQDYADKLGLRIRYRTKVESIGERSEDGGFVVALDDGTRLVADRVMLATGPRGEHVPPDIRGVEHATTYGTHSLDRKEYENKRVCIIGGKNAAFEVANHLAGHAAIITMALRSPLKHAWNTHFPGDLRSINDTFIDMFQLKSLHATIGLTVKEIVKQPDGSLALTTETDVPHWSPPRTLRAKLLVDKVILCTGFTYMDLSIFDGIAPETHSDGRLPVLSPYWESTVPGLFYIGTAMQARDRVTASSFVHGFRYNIRALFHHLEEVHHGVPLPSQEWRGGEVDVVAIAQALVERLTLADALYPLRGFLGDVLIREADGTFRLYHALPLDYVFSSEGRSRFESSEDLVIIYLEFGWTTGAARGRARHYPPGPYPVEYVLPSDHDRPECSVYLHPVLEHHRKGEWVRDLHLQESLVVRFVEDDYADFNANINRNRVANFLALCFGVPHEPLGEDFVPRDQRDQFYVPWSEERLAAWRENPDKRTCPEASYAELVGDSGRARDRGSHS